MDMQSSARHLISITTTNRQDHSVEVEAAGHVAGGVRAVRGAKAIRVEGDVQAVQGRGSLPLVAHSADATNVHAATRGYPGIRFLSVCIPIVVAGGHDVVVVLF